jgi:hypothetical protein
MKTPRELLLNRHRSAESKLDSIRQDVVRDVESVQSRQSKKSTASTNPGSMWELLLSLRWHLSAMSAIWLVAILFNADTASGSQTVSTKASASSLQPLASLQEYRRQFLLLVDPPVVESPSAPPRRSQRTIRTFIA